MKKTFVRFGDIPALGKSKNYLTEVNEIGISVYDAVELEDGSVRIIFPNLTYSACVSLSGVIERPMYEVSGDIVGTGSDGEPLLKNIRIIRQLKPYSTA